VNARDLFGASDERLLAVVREHFEEADPLPPGLVSASQSALVDAADLAALADPRPDLPTLLDSGARPSPADLAARTAQPIKYRVTRFRCPFCTRSRSSRKLIADHMARCWKNPAVRSCVTCRHFDVQPAEIEVGARGTEWCGAQDVELERIIVHCPLWTLRDGAA